MNLVSFNSELCNADDVLKVEVCLFVLYVHLYQKNYTLCVLRCLNRRKRDYPFYFHVSEFELHINIFIADKTG